jgi:pyruvate dehydrogenase E2 component (dihydrolipoamide acetyltransferase)
MTYEFKLPDIGEGVVEGEVVRWLVNEGDTIREDQPLVEIMTDKATVEIPAPRAGRIGKRMYAEGQICPVGKVLITIELEGGGAQSSPGHSTAPSTGPAAARANAALGAPGPLDPVAVTGGKSESRDAAVLATPATRKLARDLGVDIRQVRATGPAGRITSDDVRAHQTRIPVAPRATGQAVSPVNETASEPGDVRIPFRGVRKKIAERLVHSKHTAAHFTYVEEVDCTDLVAVRAKANARLAERGVKLSYLPFIIKATVGALQKFPQLNATLDEAAGEIVQRHAHHIGLATATDSGLIVPVIRDAGRKSLLDLAREIDRLAEATRTGKATREELSGSTFTITSLGLLGGLLATPIINFPEVAILGVHKIAKRPAAVGDQIMLRDMMNLSISVDHRVVDGYDAARFVAEIKATLENPGLLLVDLV